jgi:hypothetical protein
LHMIETRDSHVQLLSHAHPVLVGWTRRSRATHCVGGNGSERRDWQTRESGHGALDHGPSERLHRSVGHGSSPSGYAREKTCAALRQRELLRVERRATGLELSATDQRVNFRQPLDDSPVAHGPAGWPRQ